MVKIENVQASISFLLFPLYPSHLSGRCSAKLYWATKLYRTTLRYNLLYFTSTACTALYYRLHSYAAFPVMWLQHSIPASSLSPQ